MFITFFPFEQKKKYLKSIMNGAVYKICYVVQALFFVIVGL